MPKPTTRSAARHELVMGQLMEAAEHLFARQGVAGTSLQELAEAVGITRTGIYHYVSGKDEMLEYLVRGFTLETAQEMSALAADDGPAVERLRRGVTAMATRVAQHPQRFRLLLTSEDAFPDALAKQHRKARRDTLHALALMVSQAISEGSCRPVDPEMAAFALAGISNWIAFWYPRKGSGPALSPNEVAQQMSDIGLGGLLASRHGVGAAAVPETLALLQEDVARLTYLLKER